MFLKKKTINYTDNISKLSKAINEAEYIIIGAGSGLSTAAGYTYSGERFHKYFQDFIDKYGITDMYSGGFYPFENEEEFWAYWSRYVYINRYVDPSKQTYQVLYDLVKDKDYFVITTNVDHMFQKAGFNKERLFYTQGDYGLFQCSEPCTQETYDNQQMIEAMVHEQQNMKIPHALLPRCPHCGKPMTMNLRADSTFVEDEGWHVAAKRYTAFIQKVQNKKVLYLELGVGYNTPAIIKYPFWKMTMYNKKAIYASINKDISYIPKEIQKQSICIDNDIDDVLEKLDIL